MSDFILIRRFPFRLGLNMYRWGVIVKWRGLYRAYGPKDPS